MKTWINKFEEKYGKENSVQFFKNIENTKIIENKVWIPKPFEKVIYKRSYSDIEAQVIKCNLGGKCKIRIGLRTTLKNVDVSELEKITE